MNFETPRINPNNEQTVKLKNALIIFKIEAAIKLVIDNGFTTYVSFQNVSRFDYYIKDLCTQTQVDSIESLINKFEAIQDDENPFAILNYGDEGLIFLHYLQSMI